MKKLLVLLVSAIVSVSVFAYPIPPRPLRKLVIESEYIIWGKVLEVGYLKPAKKEDYWDGRNYALIAITEILQGNIKTDTIRVLFRAGMMCPAPGVFYEGEQVLAFLDKKEETNDYLVHALSYGVKHDLSSAEYTIYKSRITEMQAILTTQDSKSCNETVVDWLVKCAEQVATRWEGLYELSPHSDFMSYYDDQRESISRNIIITIENRKKLFDLLMLVDTLSYVDLALADMAIGVNDAVLLGYLKTKLLLFDETDFWTGAEVMERIALFTDNTELKKLVKRFKEIYFGDEKEQKEAKLIFESFIINMKNATLKISPRASGEFNT